MKFPEAITNEPRKAPQYRSSWARLSVFCVVEWKDQPGEGTEPISCWVSLLRRSNTECSAGPDTTVEPAGDKEVLPLLVKDILEISLPWASFYWRSLKEPGDPRRFAGTVANWPRSATMIFEPLQEILLLLAFVQSTGYEKWPLCAVVIQQEDMFTNSEGSYSGDGAVAAIEDDLERGGCSDKRSRLRREARSGWQLSRSWWTSYQGQN